jgi:hypothetical protein
MWWQQLADNSVLARGNAAGRRAGGTPVLRHSCEAQL